MITTALLAFALTMINILTFWLPEANVLPGNYSSLVENFSVAIWSFDYIIPMSTVIQVILAGFYLFFAKHGILFLLMFLKWSRILKI